MGLYRRQILACIRFQSRTTHWFRGLVFEIGLAAKNSSAEANGANSFCSRLVDAPAKRDCEFTGRSQFQKEAALAECSI